MIKAATRKERRKEILELCEKLKSENPNLCASDLVRMIAKHEGIAEQCGWNLYKIARLQGFDLGRDKRINIKSKQYAAEKWQIILEEAKKLNAKNPSLYGEYGIKGFALKLNNSLIKLDKKKPMLKLYSKNTATLAHFLNNNFFKN